MGRSGEKPQVMCRALAFGEVAWVGTARWPVSSVQARRPARGGERDESTSVVGLGRFRSGAGHSLHRRGGFGAIDALRHVGSGFGS